MWLWRLFSDKYVTKGIHSSHNIIKHRPRQISSKQNRSSIIVRNSSFEIALTRPWFVSVKNKTSHHEKCKQEHAPWPLLCHLPGWEGGLVNNRNFYKSLNYYYLKYIILKICSTPCKNNATVQKFVIKEPFKERVIYPNRNTGLIYQINCDKTLPFIYTEIIKMVSISSHRNCYIWYHEQFKTISVTFFIC